MAEPKPSKPSDGAMRVDTDLVRELAELLSANELTEIEVADGERRIKVVRHAVRDLLTSNPAFASLSPEAQQVAAQPAAPAAEVAAGNAIKSPMVGTAFLSPEPGADPFIAAGEPVQAGDTLLIIEAKNVMTPNNAPTDGVVKQVLVSDGQPVEFDQPLVVIG